MKRDMDLIRKLAHTIEENERSVALMKISVDGYTEEQVGYHLSLMKEAGLIHGTTTTHMNSQNRQAVASALTWAGHEFADASRNENIWNKAKKTIQEKAGTVSIAVLTVYLQDLAKKALGL